MLLRRQPPLVTYIHPPATRSMKQSTKPTAGKRSAKLAAAPRKPASQVAASKAATKATVKSSIAKGKGTAKGKSKAPPTRRPGDSSDSDDDSFNSSESEDEDEDEDDKAVMLAALEAHQRAMLGLDAPEASRRSSSSEGGHGEEGDSGPSMVFDSDDDEGFHTDDGWGADDGFVTDSEDELGAIDAAFMNKGKAKAKGPAAAKAAPKPAQAAAPAPSVPEVVFAPTGSSSVSFVSKAEKRAFMTGSSAKMMGISKTDQTEGRGKKRVREEDEEEEQSNLRLDKTLHDMLLTTILPASESAARPVEKRNALSGRLLELASYSLPGEGRARVEGANLSSHPAAVRTGLMHAAGRRAEKARADAEAAGSWVKGLGGLGDGGRKGAGVRPTGANAARGARTFGLETGKKKGMDGKKNERARGLGMGVGSFRNGVLNISEREIARVNNQGKGGRKKGKR